MITGPVRGTVADFEAIVELADTCFTVDRELGGMRGCWPHCYVRDAACMHNYRLMKDDGRVVAMVGCIPQTVSVAGRDVRFANVTAVATAPTHRGRGLMSRLLQTCIGEMAGEGYALSELGGDRARYGNYGWEFGGRQLSFQLTARSLGPGAGGAAGYEVAGFEMGQLDAVAAIRDAAPYGMRRDRALHELLFTRSGWPTWVALAHGQPQAYLSLSLRHNTVAEFGGEEHGLAAILRRLLEGPDRSGMSLRSPWGHPLNAAFASMAANWSENCPRMIRIVDLEATLRGFAGQLEQRCRECGESGTRSVTLGIAGRPGLVRLSFTADGVEVSRTTAGADAIVLDERAMVLFLFCPDGTRWTTEPAPAQRFLTHLLPLDFYLWPLERV